MRITKLEIENFRGFAGNHELVLPSGNVCVIIGKNGGGKSSVLDALAICLDQMTWSFSQIRFQDPPRIIGIDDINSVGKASKFRLHATYDSSEGGTYVAMPLNGVAGGQPFGELNDGLSNAFNDPELIVPICLYYSVSRTFVSTEDTPLAIRFDSDWQQDRNYAYQNILQRDLVENLFAQFFTEQINIENAEKISKKDFSYELPHLRMLREKIETFLSLMFEETVNLSVGSHRGKQRLLIRRADSEFNFGQLSSGEKFVASIALDICLKMLQANGSTGKPFESPGIVLIDEIEQHLHPAWQANILPALSATFPELQFIVTTHSPLVVNHLENEQLILLDNFKIRYGHQFSETYGKDVNTLLLEIMGAPIRPEAVSRQFDELGDLLEAGRINKAVSLLKELRQKIDPNDAKLLAMEDIVPLYADDLSLREDETDYETP